MRPVANFTLHALLAAAIAALATSGAAAGEARLTLGGTVIEVDSYSWSSAASSDRPARLRVTPRGGAGSDMVLKGTKIDQNGPALPPAAKVSRGDPIPFLIEMDVRTARETASGLASGKREQQPPSSGTLTINASLPGCAAGTTYAEAELQAALAVHQLKNLVVTRCEPGIVAFDYTEITTR